MVTELKTIFIKQEHFVSLRSHISGPNKNNFSNNYVENNFRGKQLLHECAM
jgi:hypothetical protein